MRLLWGELLDTDGMTDTPMRVMKHWLKITDGLQQDPKLPLLKTFECDRDEIVLLKNIAFCSLCEHHLLPFNGVAHIAYIPSGRVVGLSKIPRCLDILAARPQMQERLTSELASVISETLNAQGVAVILEASHSCMTTRGVLKAGCDTVTSSMMGLFRTDISARQEVLALIRSS